MIWWILPPPIRYNFSCLYSPFCGHRFMSAMCLSRETPCLVLWHHILLTRTLTALVCVSENTKKERLRCKRTKRISRFTLFSNAFLWPVSKRLLSVYVNQTTNVMWLLTIFQSCYVWHTHPVQIFHILYWVQRVNYCWWKKTNTC